MIVVHVFARKVLGSPLLFGEEIISYFLIWIVFCGMGYAMKTGGHVRVEIILGKLFGKSFVVFQQICNVIGVCYAGFLFMGSCLLVREFYFKHSISTMQLKMPLFIPATALVLGSFLLLLQLVAQLLNPDRE